MADILDDLIAAAYGSLTGPDAHAAFMRMLATAFRSHLVAHQVDAPDHTHAALAHYDTQGQPLMELAHAASRQPYVNPWLESPLTANLLRNGVAHDAGCVSPQLLRATEFYADILQPFDIFHSMGFVLERGAQTSMISISRSHRAGHYGQQDMVLAARLLPHLRTVHAIQSALVDQFIADLACDEPTWALASDGRVCGMNSAARSGLAAPAPLTVRKRLLHPTNEEDRAVLQTTMRGLLAGHQPHARMPLRGADGLPAAVLHLAPCRREAFLTWLLSDAPYMIAILKPMQPDLSQLPTELMRLYGLTAAEVRVAVKLLELGSATHIAQALSRSEETVRSQLKATYVKTGVHSQTQLLKLLLRLVGN